jgi:hypothetical protein
VLNYNVFTQINNSLPIYKLQVSLYCITVRSLRTSLAVLHTITSCDDNQFVPKLHPQDSVNEKSAYIKLHIYQNFAYEAVTLYAKQLLFAQCMCSMYCSIFAFSGTTIIQDHDNLQILACKQNVI